MKFRLHCRLVDLEHGRSRHEWSASLNGAVIMPWVLSSATVLNFLRRRFG